jgi:uncharacterized membrane protein
VQLLKSIRDRNGWELPSGGILAGRRFQSAAAVVAVSAYLCFQKAFHSTAVPFLASVLAYQTSVPTR